jgi:hypothetical protein
MPPTRPLRPIIPINACTLRITAAAGTELAGASLPGTLKLARCYPASLVPRRKYFTTRRPSSYTRRRFVRLSPIAKDSRLQPPVGVWAVLSPSVGGQSLNPPRRLSLGEPLPHQQADIAWAAPLPRGLAVPHFHAGKMPYRTSSSISGRFQPLFLSKGCVTHVLLTLPPLNSGCPLFRSTCMPHPRRQHSI